MMTRSAPLLLATLILAIANSPALAVSPAGYSGYAALNNPLTIPAGSSISNVAQVLTRSPADGFPTSMVIHRAVVFATAGSTTTTVTVYFPGPGEYSPLINVPANTTVPVLFETMVPVNYPGTPISASMSVIAGSGGGLTIQPSTSLTLEGIPTYPAEREIVTKSRW